MDSIREDKYYPGIQNICEGGVHLKESFGQAPNEGKLIIICHHNNTTTNDSVRKSAKEIATEPSFTTPAKDFLNGYEQIHRKCSYRDTICKYHGILGLGYKDDMKPMKMRIANPHAIKPITN